MNALSVYLLIASIAAFAVTAGSGKWLIPYLKKLNFGQTIREEGPKWHKSKQGTPTMGGIMFIIAIVFVMIIMLASYSSSLTTLAMTKVVAGLGMAVAFGMIGFADDFISIRKKRNLGLTEKQKLVMQFLVAGAYLGCVRLAGGDSTTIIPFFGKIDLGIAYYILSAVIIVGMVNAVNFTDGIDGLNSIVCFFSFACLGVCAQIMNSSGITLLGCVSAAALLGFLVWNFNPAKVFMGDTGSLFLGGILCALAFGIDMPVLLLPAGIVSLAEIVSVVLQVTYFKATGGKRLFKMSPIHHHFEMCGWNEVKICVVFGLVSLLGGIVCVLLVNFGI